MGRLRVLAARALVAAAILGAVTPAGASLVLALDLPAMTAEADRVVVGDVMSAASVWSDRGRVILTTIKINVVEIWKGEMPATRTLTIVQTGGSVGNIEMKVHGQATFSVGQRAVLFLRSSGPASESGSLVGLGQGKRLLSQDFTGRWMAGAPDRSAAVTLEAGGGMRPAAPEQVMPLEDLRRRVRALVKP